MLHREYEASLGLIDTVSKISRGWDEGGHTGIYSKVRISLMRGSTVGYRNLGKLSKTELQGMSRFE